MTDSMNFGPDWIRNLSSEGTTGGGISAGRYQLADHRYGREEMLALFDKSVKPPSSLSNFKTLYSEQTLMPLALLPTTEDERGGWQGRPTNVGGPPRGRGGPMERGGRAGGRGRGGGYQPYSRASSYDSSGWGGNNGGPAGEQPDWSPRKEFNNNANRGGLMDNWRRVRSNNEDDDGWRNVNSSRSHDKWSGAQRAASWRFDNDDERGGSERRANWHDRAMASSTSLSSRRSWDNEDHLPEWATENPTEGGGSFDERGAFHGSDEEFGDNCKTDHKKELHKSVSQQLISNKNTHSTLSSSKSAVSLIKPEGSREKVEEPSGEMKTGTKENNPLESVEPPKSNRDKNDKPSDKKNKKPEDFKGKKTEKICNNTDLPEALTNTVEEDFERLQEDFVLKLVENEDTPKIQQPPSNFDVVGSGPVNIQPPPNLVPPTLPPPQEKWYYQDPQGTRQGPFLNVEMAEWYKAGYFSNHLNVMRECDERYFLLGELINICGGENPFLAGIRFPVLKSDHLPPPGATPVPPQPVKLPDDMLPYQYLSQLALKQQISMRNLAEPWSALTLQQQEMAAQRLMMQQQQMQQVPDLQYMQQQTNPPTNPLMFMLNQMQTNKMSMIDKPPNNATAPPPPPPPNHMDPILQMQLGNLHTLQNRMPPSTATGLHNNGNVVPPVPPPPQANLPPDSLPFPGLPTNLNLPHDPQLTQNQDDPISNFLKQFQQLKQPIPMPLDSLWQKQNQFNVNNAPPVVTQWNQPNDVPLSMWDMQTATMSSTINSTTPSTTSTVEKPLPITTTTTTTIAKHDKEMRKEELSPKEIKKKKEQEEKQQKKEQEERRKQEQRKLEAEKKALEEKKKKEEEKIRKELEKAKKDAEEKRLRELEEKRRLKEQRKLEEEARKKAEDVRKQEDEKNRREAREREEKKQTEQRLVSHNRAKSPKSAPWSSQLNTSNTGISNLTDIQKAEKMKRAQEALLHTQKQELIQQHQQDQKQDKSGSIQLNWAKKPIELKKVKTLAEIQAEEQEHLAKLAIEARLAQQQKDKELPQQMCNNSLSGNIWNGQSLNWSSTAPPPTTTTTTSAMSSTTQWIGFWDDTSINRVTTKPPSTVSKSSSTSVLTNVKQPPPKLNKMKSKKDEAKSATVNNNLGIHDEFTSWCYKSLANMSSNVDIPTFVTFLRDCESALDVREYCKEYLGDTPGAQQFTTNFLEKRRSFKPKNNAHKDDMCSPAPAITPAAVQHNTEFQEVKGKNKKNKKSKMLKVDSRILGFNVTSAPDRINVGDRDYGDNS